MDELDLTPWEGGIGADGSEQRVANPRAGRLLPSFGGYRTFEPVGLPPSDPPIDLAALAPRVASASLALGRLDGLSRLVPSADLFVAMFIRKEAVLSSRIEGTQATLDDLFRYEATSSGGKEGGPGGSLSPFDDALLHDVESVFSYIRAMNECLRAVREGKRISLDMLLRAHATLMERGDTRTRPGRVRTTQNWIGAHGRSDSSSGIHGAIFIPPSPDTVGKHLEDLFAFVRVAETSQLPTLIRAGIAHAQFETIHPFLDGNGRIGRLLVTLMLVSEGALREPLLYLSAFLTKHKPDYYARLTAVRERGEWEQWLAFFLKGVEEVAIDACATAERIPPLLERHRALVEDKLAGKPSARRMVDALARHPVVTVKNIAELLDVTIPTANTLAADFENLGLLDEITGKQRDRVFRYGKYLEVLGE
jgi:Fic family protein